MSRIKKILKKTTMLLALFFSSWYAYTIYAAHISAADYLDCEKYTKKLNGGERIFGNQKFNIVLCGIGPDKNRMNDWVRLQVFSESRKLLVQRVFKIDWDTNFPRELEYGEDYLIYYDASEEGEKFETRLKIPPSLWDWIVLKLVFL